MEQLTDRQKADLAREWASILNISFDPDKGYRTEFGYKTSLGLYHVIHDLVYKRHDSVK